MAEQSATSNSITLDKIDKNFKVIIVGAGLSGLAIAHGLKKNGIDFVIVDKESHARDRNWGVTISWSHKCIETLLEPEIFARLKECQPDPDLDLKKKNQESVLMRNGATGETLVEVPFPGVRRLNIEKTRRLWSEGLDVKFGKDVTGIDVSETGVKVTFQDGSVEEGSMVVGADGGGSFVREYLLGDAAVPEDLPYEFLNFCFTLPKEKALEIERTMHPVVDVGIHPRPHYIGLFMLTKPDPARPETWIFYILTSWPKDLDDKSQDHRDDMLVELKKRIGDWADPYKAAVEAVPDDLKVRSLKLKIFKPVPWDNQGGRATLAGDSVHAMTFHRGQGANNALRDSERFVTALLSVKAGDSSLTEAISEYEYDVIKRGQTEVETSKIQTKATHDFEAYLNSPVVKHGINPTIDINDLKR